jgi:tetratricopeptide (TPR) repeat protein
MAFPYSNIAAARAKHWISRVFASVANYAVFRSGKSVLRWIAVTWLRFRLLAMMCRTIIVGICALGIWCSWNMARADYLFRQDTDDSIRAAIRLEPDAWKYYMRLALLDDEHAQQLLETAITLDPYNAEADIELGLRLEAAGDYSRAERLLLNGFTIDRTFLPRWSLANFYLRRDNMPAFWLWARRAAEMPSDSTGPLFELCWRVSPDPNEITRNILNNNPELIRQYLNFLLAKNQLPAAVGIAQRLTQFGDPKTDDPQMFSVIDQLIAANDGSEAKTLWNALIERRWVLADQGTPNNPNFARDPLPVGFDWALNSYSGLHSWPGPSGLETEFSGLEPEDSTIAQQAVVLTPGNYELEYSYRTHEIPPETGLRWQIIAPGSETPLAESPDLSSETLNYPKVSFAVLPGTSLIRLRLQYRRTLGTPRISGTLVIPSIQIHVIP